MGMERPTHRFDADTATEQSTDKERAQSRQSISLLAGFEYRLSYRPIPLASNTQRLLAFLALQERPVTRQYVAGTVWPDSSARRATANLRSALWRLNQVSFQPVKSIGPTLQLDRSVTVDLREAVAAARRLLDTSDCWCPSLDVVIDLGLTKDVLPDFYDDWAHTERETFRQLRFHALESLCVRLGVQRRFPEAIEAGIRAVEGEPLRESAHRMLISLHIAEGNIPEALRQYDQIRLLLRERLGLEPSPELKQLVGSVYRTHGSPAYGPSRNGSVVSRLPRATG